MDEKEESSIALGSDSPLSTPSSRFSTPPRAAQASFTGAPRSARNLFGAFNSATSPPASSVFAFPSPATSRTSSRSTPSNTGSQIVPLGSQMLLGSRTPSPVPSSHSTYSNLDGLMQSPAASPLAPPPPGGSSPIMVPVDLADFEGDEDDRESWSIDRSLGQSSGSGSMSSGDSSFYLDIWNTPPSSLGSSRSSRSSRAYGGVLKASPLNRKVIR